MPTSTVIMTAYNSEKYITEQLNSLLNQNEMPSNMIIVNDCSDDNTLIIIEKFIKSAAFPVILINNPERKGIVYNMNRMIQLADGDIIINIDSDDILRQNYIKTVLNYFSDNPDISLVFTDAELIDENGIPLNLSYIDAVLQKHEKVKLKNRRYNEIVIKRNIIYGAILSFRSKHKYLITPFPVLAHGTPFTSKDFSPEHHGDFCGHYDWDEWLSLVLSAVSQTGFIDSKLVQYRQHTSASTSMLRKESFIRKLMVRALNLLLFLRNIKTESKDFRKYYKNSLNTYYEIIERVSASGSDFTIKQDFENHLKAKIQFYLEKISLPHTSLLRIPIIVREYIKGNYTKYAPRNNTLLIDFFMD